MGDAFFSTNSPKNWHSDTYRTSLLTSEPAAIIRAALHNRSLCFFIFVFCFQFLFLANGEGSDNLFTLFDHKKKKTRLYHFSTNINGDVSCRSVN